MNYPDGHEVHEHECPDCGRVIYTKRRRCSSCQAEHEEAMYDAWQADRKYPA